MTPTETADILRRYNAWRRPRPDDLPMPDPIEIGEAIDAAVEMIERLEAAEKAVTEAYQRGYATGREEIGKERDELLEALTALVRDSERVKEVMLREAGIGMIDEVGLDKARAAIARATGESEAKP